MWRRGVRRLMSLFESEAALLDRCAAGWHSAATDLTPDFVPMRMLLQWHITDRCNLRCSHCYSGEDTAVEMEPAAVFEVLNRFIAMCESMKVRGHLNITGGEPFLSENFFPLVEAISRRNDVLSFSVLTNGTLTGAVEARRLRKLGCRYVQVSLEGGKAANDAIRGVGSFARIVKSVRTLSGRGIRTLVSFTAGTDNYREFASTAAAARKAGAHAVWSDCALPLGRGASYAARTMGPAETGELFEEMYRVRKRIKWNPFRNTEVLMHRALQFITLERHGARDPFVYRCTAGRNLLTVMPDGAVLPCRRMPVVVGNALSEGLVDIYYRSPLLAALRKESVIARGCSACSRRTACNGGLRCLSYAVHGDPLRRDPRCFRGPSELEASGA